MKRSLNNKGFTLVEMAVAFAILAVVMLTVTLVISTSSNSYRKISTDINLQYESQLCMNQLQEYIIDCNGYIAVNAHEDVLYVFNKTNDTNYIAYKFEKKSDSEELYFYKKTIEEFDMDNLGNFTFNSVGELMSSYVKSFSAVVTTSSGSTAVSSVTITINYGTGNETYNGRQTFALRNQTEDISSYVPLG